MPPARAMEKAAPPGRRAGHAPSMVPWPVMPRRAAIPSRKGAPRSRDRGLPDTSRRARRPFVGAVPSVPYGMPARPARGYGRRASPVLSQRAGAAPWPHGAGIPGRTAAPPALAHAGPGRRPACARPDPARTPVLVVHAERGETADHADRSAGRASIFKGSIPRPRVGHAVSEAAADMFGKACRIPCRLQQAGRWELAAGNEFVPRHGRAAAGRTVRAIGGAAPARMWRAAGTHASEQQVMHVG